MYAGDPPWSGEAAHSEEAGGFPRTFGDVQCAEADALPDPEDIVSNRGSQSGGRNRNPDVLFISEDEEDVVIDTVQMRNGVVRTPTRSTGARVSVDGSDSSRTTGTIERDIREKFYGRSYTEVGYNAGAFEEIKRLLNQVMCPPLNGFATTT